MYDSVVVGGGLIGMLTARGLKRAGHNVLLLDKGPLGAESSWAGGGILSPLYPWRYPEAVSQLAVYSAGRYRALAEALQQESGIDPEWTGSGLLILDTDEQDAALSWAGRFQQDLQIVSQDRIRQELQPGLQTNAGEAMWLPAVAQLRNPRLVRSLQGSLDYHRVEYSENEGVTGLLLDGDRVIGVRTAQREITAAAVIVTAGAWSGSLLQQAGAAIEVEPVRGQMLVFRAEPGVLQRMVLDRGHYLIPRRDGHILIGSTLEYVGFDKSTTDEAHQLLVSRAFELLPALQRFPVERHWAGLRPGSPSGVPYIGQHPHIEGLYFNCGHFRNGVILGLASVQVLLDLIDGRTPVLDPGPYALDAAH